MRTPLPLLTLLATAVVASLPMSRTPAACADDAQEGRDRALCERVLASPVALGAAVERAAAGGRVALAAAFTLDDAQRLALAVTTVGPAADADDFDVVSGPVLADRRDATRRPLAERAEVAAAARAQTLLAMGERTIAQTLEKTETLVRSAHPKTPSAVIAVRPTAIERRPWLVGEVARQSVPFSTVWSLFKDVNDGAIVSSEPPSYVKEREAAARRRVGKPLPELSVEGGRWLNTSTPPTVAKRDGRLLLVLLTNRLCEMECGPKPEVVARWHSTYGPKGLDVVTIYRDLAAWKPGTTIEEMTALVRANGLRHPVLLDWEDAYIRSLEPGPIGYPVLYLVGADGVVRWEGDSSAAPESEFAARCEAAIRATLASAASATPSKTDR